MMVYCTVIFLLPSCRWFGKCWYIHNLIKYEFDIEFEVRDGLCPCLQYGSPAHTAQLLPQSPPHSSPSPPSHSYPQSTITLLSPVHHHAPHPQSPPHSSSPVHHHAPIPSPPSRSSFPVPTTLLFPSPHLHSSSPAHCHASHTLFLSDSSDLPNHCPRDCYPRARWENC